MPLPMPVLQRHKIGNLFVETGTDKGDCVKKAIAAGFDRVISIEINPKLAARAQRIFARNRNISILRGSSPIVLGYVMSAITEPATFWLDAHPDHDSPVLLELAHFLRHPIKAHTILIDDRRLMQGHWESVKEPQVRRLLKRINPSYQITTDQGVQSHDIIVAKI
jgi:hypothetical protein